MRALARAAETRHNAATTFVPDSTTMLRMLSAAAVLAILAAGLAHAQVTGSVPNTGGFDDQQFYWNVLPSFDRRETPEQREIERRYNETLKTIIPEEISFFRRRHRQNEWNVIIAMDQSGSMATSLIYGGIMGAILASMPAVETHVVAFNHEDVVDLTEHCSDPVDLLFGVQLGGAEDYWKATSYCERFMHTPAKTLYILLADLYDTSPNESRFVKRMEFLLESGVKAVQLLEGDAVWKAFESGSWQMGGWDPNLFEACLTRTQTLAQTVGSEVAAAASVTPRRSRQRSGCSLPWRRRLSTMSGPAAAPRRVAAT